MLCNKSITKLIACPKGRKSAVIPDGIIEIGDLENVYINRCYAFEGCENLESVVIPESVTSIGYSAFSGCSSLTSLTIPSSVASIGDYAFKNCASLSSVSIPDSVTSIGGCAFKGCTKLGRVTLSNSISKIEYNTFEGCKSLSSVTIPFGVKSISSNAFNGCSNLESVDIPSSVTQISYDAFLNCGLKSVTIPKTVTSIGSHAFGFNDSNSTYSKISGFKIYCFEGSAAETYAKENGFKYDYYICKHDCKEVTTEPTCTSDGSIKAICVHCGTQYGRTTVIKALGHDYIETGIVKPTCTDRGYTTQKCTRCGRTLNTNYVKALGHNYIGTVTAPNCKKKGYTTHVCSRCSDSYVDSYTDPVANAHIYGDWVVTFETTDTICGTKERLCKLCKHRDVLVDHNKKYIKTVKPTCTKDGYDIYKCKRCGEELHENMVAAKGHRWLDWLWKWSPYYDSAKLEFVCLNNDSHKQYVDASISKKSYSPTCTSDGRIVYTATVSFEGEKYYDEKTEILKRTGHYWNQPIWRWDGNNTYATFVCYYDKKHTQIINANVASEIIKPATCTNPGTTKYTATVVFNGKKYTDTYTDKAVSSGKCGDNLIWTFRNGKLTISGTGSMYNWDPFKKNDSPFSSDKITSIVIGSGVTSIGNCAFTGCTKLKSVSIPATVKTIGEGAFQNCYHLSSVAIPNGVTSIGDGAFWCCLNLASISLPSSLRTIGYLTFGGCTSLKSIVIPNGVTTIGEAAFSGSNSLASISIPSTVKTIGALAFNSTKWLSNMRSKNPLVVVNGLLVDAQTYKGATLTLSSSIKGICGSAFSECKNLTSITIPSSVTSIGNDAFYNCAKLKSIVIPNSVQRIEDFTFYGCTSLSSVTIRSGVKSIGYQAFYDTPNLKSITIPASVGTIDKCDLGYYWDIKTKKRVKMSGFTIYGYTGSSAEKYAKNNGFKFVSKGTHTHSYINTVVAATCKSKGYTVHKCKTCGYSYTDAYKAVSPNAHNYGSWSIIKKATVSTKGSMKRTCSLCGKTETSAYVYYSRIAGQNRFATAAEVSKASFNSTATVVLACGLTFHDAMVAVPLANAYNAPLLLATEKLITVQTEAELKRLNTKKVIVVSTNGAIGAKAKAMIKALNLKATYIEGKTCFETAAKVAKVLQNKTNKAPDTIFFATDSAFADALSASPVAAIKGAPILYLKNNGSIDAATANYLKSVKGKVKNAYIIGGDRVISNAMMKNVAKALGLTVNKTVVRVAGKNRYETCVAVNKKFKSVLTGTGICVAKGLDFPDALAGGVYAASTKQALFLADGKKLQDCQNNYLKSKNVGKITVFGGIGAVPDELVKLIAQASV